MTSFKQLPVTLMLHLLFALTLFAVTSVQVSASIPAGSLAPSEPIGEADLLANYGNLPLYFERNLGQTDAQVHYLAKTSGYTFFLTPERMAFNLALDAPQAPDSDADMLADDATATIAETTASRQYGLYVDFVGAKPSPQIQGQKPQEGVSSYFIGNDESQWVSGAPHYSEVRYESLYEGIDAIFYGNQSRLQYDFIVAPHADPTQIQLQINPAEHVEIADNGDLHLHIGDLIFTMQAPYSYQMIDGVEREIASEFALDDDGMVRFALGEYDPSHTLIIDPLVYSTYLGGTIGDVGYAIAVDGAGNATITGQTRSTNFPTTAGAFQTTNAGGGEVFVIKLNATGTGLVYSTYLGGTNSDIGYGIAVDGAGNATITGQTFSSNFPTTAGAYDTTANGNSDVFVSKLNATGTGLVYSTYLGGTSNDYGYGIAVDGADNATITGETFSSDFPTTAGAFQTTNAGGLDAFVSKLNAAGTGLVYSTYLGGGDNDYGYGIAVDGADNATITGETFSSNFPTTAGAFQTTNAGSLDVFVSKLNATGTGLVYSTYLGGTSSDFGRGIAVDGTGNATITGQTGSTNFPTTAGAFHTTNAGGLDVFVSKLNATGTGLVYSTYLGGTSSDYGQGIAVDGAGNATITGQTFSSDFPTTAGAFQTTNAGSLDAFVSKLNATGTGLVYSTYLGGTSNDYGYGIAVDGADNATVTGLTFSSDFPTTAGAFQTTYAGGADAFVSKLNVTGTVTLEFDPATSTSPEATGMGDVLRVTTSDNNPTASAVTVDVAVTGGTATAADYNLTGTITIPAGTAHNSLVSIASGFTVTDDSLFENDETVELTLSNPTGAVLGAQTTHTHTIENDDTAGVTVNPNTGLVTTEASGTATFDVVLTSAPTANVTINLASTDTTEGTVSPTSITFTPTNWDTAQTVTVTGADDAVVDGDIAYTITTTMTTGADTTYNAIDPDDVSVTNNDDDTAPATGGTGDAVSDGASAGDGTPQLILSGLSVAGVQGQGTPRPGENALWQFSIFNNTGSPVNGLTARVTYPDDDMQGISANASNGTNGIFSRGSLLADFNLGTIGAGETITLNIVTRLPDRAGIFNGTLTVNASGDSTTLSLLTVGQLPSTGETPAWAVFMRQLLGLD